MDLALSSTQQSIREVARRFAKERVAPQAKAHDREERISPALLKEMASLGLMGVNVAPELGGAGAGAVAYALAMMEISGACASTSVVMAVTNMCAELIARFGTEAQKSKYVDRLVSGEALAGAFALS
ncbi:MAG TPA: acyl-CoA dehydrogenase family protein, partial [Myxococcaceae bacterium]|nr:acyl-CoA dehydrogenase family protein [Myxococcaceae bacterium]